MCAGERAAVGEFVHRVLSHGSTSLFNVKTKEMGMFFFNFSVQPRQVDRVLNRGGLTLGVFTNIDCANVEVETKILRLVSVDSFFGIIGISPKSKDVLDSFVKFLLHPSIRSPKSQRILVSLQNGYFLGEGKAERLFIDCRVITDFCRLMLQLRSLRKISGVWLQYAQNCERFMVGLADTGLVALIDEATGYRKRRHDEYKQLFLQFIQDEHTDWLKEFQDPFFDGIYKIYNLPRMTKSQHPRFFGAFIAKYVYYPLANSRGAILENLREKNPMFNLNGRQYKHHQFLTEKVGKVALRDHLSKMQAVFALSRDKGSFKRNFIKVFPQPLDQLELDFGDDV